MIVDYLPALDVETSVSKKQIIDFRAHGHIFMPSILNEQEVGIYHKVINRAATKFNLEKRKLAERDTYGKAFLQIMNLWERDLAVRQFTLAKRFGKIAADLLGVDRVRLYHDQALYKEPNGGPTPWHQDQYYWPLDTTNTVTMWMPLVDIKEDMGMLTFASSSHRNGVIGNIPISDESERFIQDYVNEKQYPIHRETKMHAGDATWHYGCTLHNAPGNSSQTTTREVMTVIFFADDAKITEPINKHQENDRQTWLGGLPVGSQANSKLNPII